MSEEILRHQNQNLQQQNEELQAKLNASRPADPLLTKLAKAIRYIDEVGSPGTPSTPIGESTKKPKPTSRPPSSSGDRQTRHYGRYLANDVERALTVFWNRTEGADRPKQEKQTTIPDEDGNISKIPTVRCRTGSCDMQGKRRPAYTINTRDASVTVNRVCGGCGVPYPGHPTPP